MHKHGICACNASKMSSDTKAVVPNPFDSKSTLVQHNIQASPSLYYMQDIFSISTVIN